jgi:hypothetical protein
MRYLPLAAALAASLALCACATPNPAAVAQAAPSKPATATAANGNKDPEICATVENTGSRLAAKECHTASEWAALRAEGNDDITNQAQRHLPSAGGN